MSIDKNSRAARQMNGQSPRRPERRPASRRPISSPGRRLPSSETSRVSSTSGRRRAASGGDRRGTGKRTGRKYKKGRRLAPWKIAVLAGLLLIVTSVSGAVYYVNHLLGKTMDLGVDMEEKTNPNLDIETKRVQKGFWKIAVFGVDSTDGNLGKGANSDVIIICSINWETGEIKMSSVYRDTFLKVGEKNPYRKVNEAYARGGPDQAINALNENLDIEVDDFVSVNWKAIADGINILGGVDIEVTPEEFTQINGYITSVVENTGIPSFHLKAPGFQHVDGVQAVAYCRLRKMDTDFRRTERQRAVISQCLAKAKSADLKVLRTAILACFPQVSTSVDMQDLIDLALIVKDFHIGDTAGFPFDLKIQDVGKLDCVVPVTLSSNVVKLHQFLFGTENYKPSDHVEEISKDIAYLSAKQPDSGEKLNEEDIERMNSSTGSSEKTTKSREEDEEDETEETRERTSESSDESDENEEHEGSTSEGESEGREDPDNNPDESASEGESESNGSESRTHTDESSGDERNPSSVTRDDGHGNTNPTGSTRPTAPAQESTTSEENLHLGPGGTSPTAPGTNVPTAPSANPSAGPGGNTSAGPGGSPGPGANTSQPSAPGGDSSAGPGAAGNGRSGTVYTTRPIATEPNQENEGGPGYEH